MDPGDHVSNEGTSSTAQASYLDVVLDLLDDSPGGPPVVRGRDASGREPVQGAAIEQVRESTEAQLVLLGLASAFTSERAGAAPDSDSAVDTQLYTFVETARERLGVDLLQTANDNPERLPPTVPRTLLDDRDHSDEPTTTGHASTKDR